MGTRGQFYLYIKVAGKKLLVYTTYSHYDGYFWLDEINAYLKELFKAQGTWSVPELVQKLKSKFGDTEDFACDAEAIEHMMLVTPDLTDSLDLTKFPFEERETCEYGSQVTGVCGDCYIINSYDEIPDTTTSEYHSL